MHATMCTMPIICVDTFIELSIFLCDILLRDACFETKTIYGQILEHVAILTVTNIFTHFNIRLSVHSLDRNDIRPSIKYSIASQTRRYARQMKTQTITRPQTICGILYTFTHGWVGLKQTHTRTTHRRQTIWQWI